MAPRVQVPMDFGLKLLEAPSHGNLTLELATGLDPVKVNTAIMSFNSPVIYRHTTELHQNTVDVVEFSREAVLCFSRACYSGKLDGLDMSIFRHLYKMSVVFEVDWMKKRCLDLYGELLGCTVQKEYNYDDLLVFYNEVEYASIHLKQDDLFDLMSAELKKVADKGQQFINEYIADIDVLITKEVDVVCKLAEDSKNLLVKSVIRSLEKDNSCVSQNTNHILKNVDLVICLKTDPELLCKLHRAIESVENVTKKDTATHLKMLRQVYEMFAIQECPPVSNVTPNNLFHSFREISICNSIDELISYIVYDSKDPSLFTLLDGMYSWSLDRNTARGHDYENLIGWLENIKTEFGWDTLPYDYIKNLYSGSNNLSWFHGLKTSDTLINSLMTKEGYSIFYSGTVSHEILFSTPGEKSFILRGKSNIDSCMKTGDCCRSLQIFTGPKRGDKGRRYNIQLCPFPGIRDSESQGHLHNEFVLFLLMFIYVFTGKDTIDFILFPGMKSRNTMIIEMFGDGVLSVLAKRCRIVNFPLVVLNISGVCISGRIVKYNWLHSLNDAKLMTTIYK